MKINWGTGILMFIILFLVLSGVFIVFSFQHNNDLVTEDYYEQGATYSKQIEINKRSAIYNDSVNISNKGSEIEIQLSKCLASMTDSFQIFFFRPSDKTKDYKVGMRSNISLRVPSAQLLKGRYIIKISWHNKKEKYLLEKDLFVN